MSEAYKEKLMKEKLLSCLPDGCRNWVSVANDDYEEMVKKLVDYFEDNKGYHITRGEILAEKVKGTKAVNTIKQEVKPKAAKSKAKSKVAQGGSSVSGGGNASE